MEPRLAGKRVVFDEALSVNAVSSGGIRFEVPGLSSFGTFNGAPAFEFRPGVDIHAIGGDQVLMCRVNYEPGFGVSLHAHEHTEQVMLIVAGDLTMTIAGETKQLAPGDTVVVNRGVAHELVTENGCTFIEALAPVPLDHVPDRERDLVLGDLAGSMHVEK